MTKRKLSKEETPEEAYVREHIEKISSQTERNERIGWNRKRKQLDIDIKAYTLVQTEILKLKKKHQKLENKVKDSGVELRSSCVHPHADIIYEGDGVFICKFCETRISFNE